MLRYLLLLVGVCAVGSAALLARMGLDAGMSAQQLAMWRLTLASAILIAWRLIAGQSAPPLRPETKARLVVAGVCLALHFVTWFASLQYLSVARSTLLVATAPLWVGLLGLFLPQMRPARGFWVGLAIAAVGITLVTTQGAGGTMRVVSGGGAVRLGDALAISGAILVVPYLLLVQRVQAEFGTVRTVTWTYASAALCLWLMALPQGSVTLPRSLPVWLSVIGMAVAPQLIGHTALNRALQHFTASQVASATLLEPVFAAALAWLLLGERVTLLQSFGAALLLGGVALALREQREQDPLTVQASTLAD
jgi:drug/metabolite transporter (DMT)-like permease